MNNQILTISLSLVGLTDFQVKLYLEIHSDCDSTISNLARQLDVQRLKIYENLEILVKLNLAKTFKRGQNQIVNSTKLVEILKLLENHKFKAVQIHQELKEYIAQHQGQIDYKITQYRGIDNFTLGFFTILEKCKTDSMIYHFGDNNSIFNILGQTKSNEWINLRLKKKITTFEILPDNFVSKFLHDKDEIELRQIRILPKNKIVKTSYLLFNSSVAIWNVKDLKLEIIEDVNMYETFKTNFDLVWGGL